MPYAGGFRQRLISDSVYHMMMENLGALGWFDSGRQHGVLSVRTESVKNDEEIPLNTVVISETVTTDDQAELGSNLGDISTTFYVDIYAENEALGKEFIHDVRDIIKGRLVRTATTLPVYDWTMATPPVVFYCEIEDVVVDQARDYPKPWQKNWWTCRFDVVDVYDGQ